MSKKYIYAGTRARAMENELLTKPQLEVFLSAKSVQEAQKALQDTFLSPFLAKYEKEGLNEAISQSLLKAKRVLESIAPEPDLMDILWLKYDFLNLKTIVKGKIAGLANLEIKNNCFLTGKYPPEKLIKAFEENKVSFLDRDLGRAVKESLDHKEVSDIDIVLSRHYFEKIKVIAKKTKHGFIKEYVIFLIDVFNIISKLRIVNLREMGVNVKDIFIEGGVIMEKDLKNEKDILEKFKRLGGEKKWVDALDYYKKSKSYVLIEKVASGLKLNFLKEKSRQIFSPAPLFSYFESKVNDTSMIKAVLAGKELGIPEKDIRFLLKKTYA